MSRNIALKLKTRMDINLNSAIYSGVVQHQRFVPMKQNFKYRIFMLLLDLDELPEIFKPYWLWSAKRPNIAYFRRADHLGDHSKNLKQSVIDLVFERTGHRLNGSIRLLTHLRYWGYCFNPVSFYYCFDESNSYVEVIVAEVHNTPWNQQHCYVLLPQYNLGNQERQHFIFPKEFHVSPFMPMDMSYDWCLSAPRKSLFVHMKNLKQQTEHFNATLNLKRQELNHKNLAKLLLNHPFMTAKVITMIYWQALKLKCKGATFYSHPQSK